MRLPNIVTMKPPNILTKKEKQVYEIIKNKEWYSYGLQYIMRLLDLQSVEEMTKIAVSLSNKIGDKVNIFSYNGVYYVGLETRRLDYERDRREGKNKVEKLIKQGHYKCR